MKVFSYYELWWRSTKQVEVQIDQVPGIVQEAFVRGLKFRYNSPRTTLSENLMSIWALN